MTWLDATISGRLQLMLRLFEESTTVTPRADLGSGQTDPDIAVDTRSNTCAVWVDYRNGNADIYFAYRPAGGSWGSSERVNDDDSTAGQYRPAIAVDASGNAYIVWEDSREGNRDIYFAYRSFSGSWDANVKINDGPNTAWPYSPDIAVDANGNAYAVWADFRNSGQWYNSDIYFAYRPVGGDWGLSVRVNDDVGAASQHSPAIAVDVSGNVYVVWTDQRNGNSDIYFAFRPVGSEWGANAKVSDDPGTATQQFPAIAVDAGGNAYAVWEDARNDIGGNYIDIYFAFRSAGGSWGTNVGVSEDPGTTYHQRPDITVDESGNAYAVWVDYRNGHSDIYFALRPPGGSWGTNAKVNDDPGEEEQWSPSVAVDVGGNAYAVWEDVRNGNEDIFSATRPASGVWGSNARVDDDTSGKSSQGGPAIAVDTSGNAYAVWVDKRNGNNDIYFAYRPAGGGWGTNVRVNDDSGTASQDGPDIGIDASGNVYAVWQDERNGHTDIYFAYRTVTSTTWSTNVRVNDDAGMNLQNWPAIAVDDSGNAYAVWGDTRNGGGWANQDIYSSYRPAGGNWETNVRVNDDMGTVEQPQVDIAVDAYGNAYAAWGDSRNGDDDDYDIYFAYRAAISTTWSTNVQVNDETGTVPKFHPFAIAVDLSGNAYAVWPDNRNGDWDLYFAYRPVGDDWRDNVQVNDDTGMVWYSYPSIAVDASGNVYAVWGDNSDIYFATRPVGSGWGTSVQVNYDTVTAPAPYSGIAVDGSGNIYAVWTDTSYGTRHVHFARSLTTPEYALEGIYTSPELDAEVTGAVWESLAWQGFTPSGTSLIFETRSRIAGGSWSEWTMVKGSAIASLPGQYLQYRITFSTIFPDVTPKLDQVQITYRAVETPSAPRFATPCGVTNQISPTLKGWAAAGSTVRLYVNGLETDTTTAGTDGTFSFSPHLGVGSHTLTATVENSGGIGPASVALVLTVDPTLPYDPINVRAGPWTKHGWQLSVPRDANGCADPDNDWRVWPRRHRKFRVQVPVSYTTSAAVTVTVGTQTLALTEESDKLFAEVFQPPIYEGDFIIEVTADGNTTAVDGGPVLIDSNGVVYEASGTISDTISGARVTCYYWDSHSSQWIVWDAWTCDQVNPQMTLEDGYYSFYVPSGTYRVVAEKEGYPVYTSPNLVVVGTPVRHNIPLGWQVFMPVVLRNY